MNSNSNGVGAASEKRAINLTQISHFRQGFFSNPKNTVAQNACTKSDPLDACTLRTGLQEVSHVFSHKVEQEGKPLTNQKSSGRCWLFAVLNCIRVPFMKHYNLDEFEFSQSYLFFFDKLERCNYFLNNMVETFRRGEVVNGRLITFLLQDPISDGGQWGMIVNLVLKYGLMPKKNFPESFSSESSARMNTILRSKLRHYCMEIRVLMSNKPSETEIQQLLDRQVGEIYQILAICLGIPSDTFTWEYVDKAKAYNSVGPITPLQFYEDYVRPIYNVENKVCLVHDPRPDHSYGQAYTVEFLGNVVGGNPTIYNNQPVELLMKAAADAVKAGEVVWHGCEVAKRLAAKQGLMDLNIHDYVSTFGVDVPFGTKADRLIYGESAMSHAMAFTAVSFDENGVATKFRVENSWGDDRGDKGYFLMTADWFKEYVFEVVVDKAHLTKEVLAVLEQDPIVLPAWDPMGTLACKNCCNGKSLDEV